MEYRIREIEERDDKAVEGVIRACLKEFGGDHEGTAWMDPDLCRFSSVYSVEGRRYWVAEDAEGKIAGGCGVGPLKGRVCELQKMYCLPEARGTGLAHRLMDLALAYAAEYYDRCYLETFSNMLAARRFYKKHGFETLDRPLGDTGHFSCDVWMIRDLTKKAEP